MDEMVLFLEFALKYLKGGREYRGKKAVRELTDAS